MISKERVLLMVIAFIGLMAGFAQAIKKPPIFRGLFAVGYMRVSPVSAIRYTC
jgi:hypothetical protein